MDWPRHLCLQALRGDGVSREHPPALPALTSLSCPQRAALPHLPGSESRGEGGITGGWEGGQKDTERQRPSALPCWDPTLLQRERAPCSAPRGWHSQPGPTEAGDPPQGPWTSGVSGGRSQGPGPSSTRAAPCVSPDSGQGGTGPHSAFPPALLAALLQPLFNCPPPALAKPRGARWVTVSPGPLPGENPKGQPRSQPRVAESVGLCRRASHSPTAGHQPLSPALTPLHLVVTPVGAVRRGMAGSDPRCDPGMPAVQLRCTGKAAVDCHQHSEAKSRELPCGLPSSGPGTRGTSQLQGGLVRKWEGPAGAFLFCPDLCHGQAGPPQTSEPPPNAPHPGVRRGRSLSARATGAEQMSYWLPVATGQPHWSQMRAQDVRRGHKAWWL